MLVYDFAVSADDVVLDTFGPKFLTGSGKMSDRVAVISGGLSGVVAGL